MWTIEVVVSKRSQGIADRMQVYYRVDSLTLQARDVDGCEGRHDELC